MCKFVLVWTFAPQLFDIFSSKNTAAFTSANTVGGFPAKFVSSRISQNIFFHMIGNKELPFHFLRGGHFHNWSLPFAGPKNEKVKFQRHLKDNTNLELP